MTRISDLAPVDGEGYPGLESEAECEAMVDAIAYVQVAFRLLGLSWEHPRVRAFLAAVEARVGAPVGMVGCRLPAAAWVALATKLEQELADSDWLTAEQAETLATYAFWRGQKKLLGGAAK